MRKACSFAAFFSSRLRCSFPPLLPLALFGFEIWIDSGSESRLSPTEFSLMSIFSVAGDGGVRQGESLADWLIWLDTAIISVESFVVSTTGGPGGLPAICALTSRKAAGDIFFGFELFLRVGQLNSRNTGNETTFGRYRTVLPFGRGSDRKILGCPNLAHLPIRQFRNANSDSPILLQREWRPFQWGHY